MHADVSGKVPFRRTVSYTHIGEWVHTYTNDTLDEVERKVSVRYAMPRRVGQDDTARALTANTSHALLSPIRFCLHASYAVF